MKRSIDEAENCDTSYDMETDIVVNPKKERQKSCNLDNQFASISREHVLNFPIPDDNGKVCIVKVKSYSNTFYNTLRILYILTSI